MIFMHRTFFFLFSYLPNMQNHLRLWFILLLVYVVVEFVVAIIMVKFVEL